ncbi:MAG: hypothetical protein ABI678_14060 [Kofleriaceae bacterium]
MISWRNATIVLALVCCIQRWQSCTTSPPKVVEHVTEVAPRRSVLAQAFVAATPVDRPAAKRTFFGIKPPAWASNLLPQPGENLLAYRDRILPLAEVAIAPQRARVARLRDQLDAHQRTELDAAVTETATAIEARIMTAVMNGELQAFKPMTGVTMAREVLDLVDRGNAQFVSSLDAAQRAKLASSKFDFADYLLFSTKWEDALK